MQFKELKIGEKFVFKFDNHPEWKYKRVGADRIVCISAPSFYSKSVGSIYPWNDPSQEVKLIAND